MARKRSIDKSEKGGNKKNSKKDTQQQGRNGGKKKRKKKKDMAWANEDEDYDDDSASDKQTMKDTSSRTSTRGSLPGMRRKDDSTCDSDENSNTESIADNHAYWNNYVLPTYIEYNEDTNEGDTDDDGSTMDNEDEEQDGWDKDILNESYLASCIIHDDDTNKNMAHKIWLNNGDDSDEEGSEISQYSTTTESSDDSLFMENTRSEPLNGMIRVISWNAQNGLRSKVDDLL